ncbi:MAG: septal ring lytic transglycosylase RlpA family protein [Beijerinckiaceae bacterium]
MFDSSRARPRHASPGLLIAGLGALSAVLAGCAQDPVKPGARARTSEYFPSSKYGPASERVVADGQAVPRGGGQRLVGRPYTVAGKRYVPREVKPGYTITGNASWYGSAFHGRRTANGEVYDMRALSAAHPTMPLPSYARVTNLKNGYSVIVRVNDRGPFHAGRVLDVSQKVAETLDFRRSGTGRVKVDYVGPAGLAGSDDSTLLATLRTDGRPAMLDGPTSAPVTMVAEAPAQLPRRPASEPEPAPPSVASIPAQPPAPPETTVVAATAAMPPTRAPSGVAQQNPTQAATASGALLVASFPAYAPLPPPRPLDLGTIPGADTPIGPTRRRAPQPAFFAEPSPVASTLIKRGPFDGVNLDGLQPLR